MTRMKNKGAPISVEDRRQIILGAWDIANEQASGKSVEFHMQMTTDMLNASGMKIDRDEVFEVVVAEHGKEEKPENLTPMPPTHPCTGWGCWPDLAWKRSSRAVVAVTDNLDAALVIEYDGVHLDYEISENGMDREADSLGLSPPDTGLWIWEGSLVDDSIMTDYGKEHGLCLEGTFRRLTMPELLSLSTGNRVLKPDPINPDTALELARALRRKDQTAVDRIVAWLIGLEGIAEADLRAMVESFDPTWEDDVDGGAS